MASTKDKAAGKVQDVKPYVERALKDEDLRENLKSAFEAAREVYADLLGDRGMTGVASKMATDKDIQENLRKAVDELREASDRVRGKDDHTGRNATLLLAGITLGILFNPVTGPATRSWLKDRVFGPNDEFGYGDSGQSSFGTSEPSQPAAAAASSSAETDGTE
jgi:hypothetical protein